MRLVPVVIGPPGFNGKCRIFQVQEPVVVQRFVTETAVETLNKVIVDRLAGSNEAEVNPSAMSPSAQHQLGETGAVVADDLHGAT